MPRTPNAQPEMDKGIDKAPEQIRQQMQETRAALTCKVEMLEKQVMSDVESAATAVEETVVQFREAAQETIQSVKHSFKDAADTVRNSLDLRQQVEKRPWEMVMGATALGFLGGCLLHFRSNGTFEKTFQNSEVSGALGPELTELKGLVVGSLLGALRDLSTEAAPKSIERQMGDIF